MKKSLLKAATPPELKPCPFCGGDARQSESECSVYCPKCCRGVLCATSSEALLKWNTRAHPDLDKVDSLVAAIEGNLSGMAHNDLVLTCQMLERGRATWRKEAEDAKRDLDKVREALEPFAKCATNGWVRSLRDDGCVWQLHGTTEEPHRHDMITAGQIRAAHAALALLAKGGEA